MAALSICRPSRIVSSVMITDLGRVFMAFDLLPGDPLLLV
jgi:hypothetical protein